MSPKAATMERLEQLKKVARRIKQTHMQIILDLTSEELDEVLLDWAIDFGWEIDGDYIQIQPLPEGATANLEEEIGGAVEITGGKAGKKKAGKVEMAPPTGEKFNYHGTMLVKPDFDVMNQLEQLLRQPLPLQKSNWDGFGFVERDGRVNSLDLANKGLNFIPENIGAFQALESLSLYENPITTLPDSLFTLKNLKILDLQGCKLEGLSEKIGNLVNLEELTLTDNENVGVLPDSIRNCIHLKELKIDSIGLTALPETIGTIRFQLNACKCLA